MGGPVYCPPLTRVRQVDVGSAGVGVVPIRARGRPRGHEEQVRGQRPGVDGSEQAVLQDELPGIGPVVLDLLCRVIAHDVGLPLGQQTFGNLDPEGAPSTRSAASAGSDVPVHAPPGDVDLRCPVIVRTPQRPEARGVKGMGAPAPERVRHAHLDAAVRILREAVRPREGAEVMIERPVLLNEKIRCSRVEEPTFPASARGSLPQENPPRAASRPST